MAMTSGAMAPCVVKEASVNKSWPTMTCGAPLEAQGPEPEKLPEIEDRLCRRPTCSSDASTEIGDTGSDMSDSPRSACSIAGNVVSLCFSAQGCRAVQDALVQATSNSKRELLVSELHGHAIKAMRCPHANHVLQKYISIMPAAYLQFMIDELLVEDDLVRKVASHRYGGRIVRQLLSKCRARQAEGIAEAILQDAVALSSHTFGGYAVIQLLEFGTAEQKYSLVRSIERNMGIIARSSSGGGVIAAAMNHAAPEDVVWIARAVIQDLSLVTVLACRRHGNGCVVQALNKLSEQERTKACNGLMRSMAELKASRYGRKVAAYLEGISLV
mmetsp:Transcript_40090/g.105657  ORF Transcript_40090/g.105657 Transcript_40090/m.105657 type:complete len:329 (-) Transcript_40090:291-1277(-)